MILKKIYKKIAYVYIFIILTVNLYSCNKSVNYGFMQITSPKVFTNEIFAIKFSISIKGDRKHKSIDKIIEDADIEFQFDTTMLEYVASNVISTISEYKSIVKEIRENESIGTENNGILKIENLSAKEGRKSSISLVMVFKAIKHGDTKVVIKSVSINGKDYIAPYMKTNYSLVNIKKYEGSDENKFDAWYKDKFGNWYYYVNDRTEKIKGWFKDYRDKQKYYFDEDTGIMVVGPHNINGQNYFFNNIRDFWDNWYEIGDGFYECYGRERKTYGALLY